MKKRERPDIDVAQGVAEHLEQERAEFLKTVANMKEIVKGGDEEIQRLNNEREEKALEITSLKSDIKTLNEDKTHWFREAQASKDALEKLQKEHEALEITTRTLIKLFTTDSII